MLNCTFLSISEERKMAHGRKGATLFGEGRGPRAEARREPKEFQRRFEAIWTTTLVEYCAKANMMPFNLSGLLFKETVIVIMIRPLTTLMGSVALYIQHITVIFSLLSNF